MFGIWIAALFLLDTAKGRDVCYQRVGCFSNNPPWTGTLQRPLLGFPSSPERVKTTFLLYTRDNPNRYQEISVIKPSTIKASNFRTNRTTRFLLHGYSIGNDIVWLIDMCKLMLQVEDVNCIVVDWRGGADVIYTEAVSNVRIVGAELNYLMDLLERDYGYTPANIHIIGHSLGAHAAGEAGRRKRGIARITGLDPAGPYFHSTPPTVRLDPSDAEFVDVIHSNAGRLFFDFAVGIIEPSGHLDFYPNGGRIMPGCPLLREQPVSRDVNEVMRELRTTGCAHVRSLRYYSESIISPNGFLGYPCRSYQNFLLGSCFPCPEEGCPMMGHYADAFPGKTKKVFQIFYLNTGSFPPYARCRKKINVKVCTTQTMWGSVHTGLTGTNTLRRGYMMFNGLFNSGNNFTRYFDTDICTDITKVEFFWRKNPECVCRGNVGAETVTIQLGENGLTSTFCGQGPVQSTTWQTLPRC